MHTTAAEAYKQTAASIDAMIARLQLARQAHARQAAASPRNWGYAGDAKALEENLQRALESMGA